MRPAFSVAALKLAIPRFDIRQSIGDINDYPFVLQQYWLHYRLTHSLPVDYFFGLKEIHLKQPLASSFDIALHVWRPHQPRATLWVVHGYLDHVGLYHHLIRWAVEQRWALVAFDLPGHGLSSGPTVAIDDFGQYRAVLMALMDQLQPVLPQPSFVVGQSTGASIIVDTLLNEPFVLNESPWNKVVLLAPLVRPLGWRFVNMSYRLVKPFSEYVPRTFNGHTNDPDFLSFLQTHDPFQSKYISVRWVGAMIRWANQIETKPLSRINPLIVQGDLDQTVDYPFNLSVLQRQFNQPRIQMLAGAYHHLVNESQIIRDKMFMMIKNYFVAENDVVN